MKTLIRTLLPATALLALLILVACIASPVVTPTTAVTAAATFTPSGASVDTEITNVDDSGSTRIDQVALSSALAPISAGQLSTAEREGLLYMREEEKLAGDVYLTLYEQWQLPVFQNIANSEATHTETIKMLLDRYGLDDPAAGKEIGSFTNSTLQALYDQLVAEGSKSLADALRVGATIEEIDILDLEERIAQTDKPDIQLVYENLMKGSRNHLRAFTGTLQRQTGETYQPQYLGQDAYEEIINTPLERGRVDRSGQSQGRGRQG